MLVDIVKVAPLANYHLSVRFADGVEARVNVARMTGFTGIFAPLSDPAYFKKVRVDLELGTVVWPNGADLDPVSLYAQAIGRSIDDLEDELSEKFEAERRIIRDDEPPYLTDEPE